VTRFVIIAFSAAGLIACSALVGPSVPGSVRPTLEAWRAIGLTCDDPVEDNVPSGLVQWGCRGTVDGVELSGTLDGDDRGVFGLQFVVPATTPADTAEVTFAHLVDATPSLDGHESEIVAFISGWPGLNTIGSFGDATVRADLDEIWRTVTISVRSL
jgi:hypothetical protein